MLVRKYYLKDIKDYEDDNNVSILDYFNRGKIYELADLIQLGNRGMTNDQACETLDNYLDNHTIEDAYLEIKDCLLGKQSENNDNDIDVEEFKSMSDIYSHLCMEMMSVGISYGDFWNMSTKDMYRAFDSIQTKVINDANRQLELNHASNLELANAIWGHVEEDAPRIEIKKKNSKEEKLAELYKQTGKQLSPSAQAIVNFGRKAGMVDG